MFRKRTPAEGAQLIFAGALAAIGLTRYVALSHGDRDRADAHAAVARARKALDDGKHIAAQIREFTPGRERVDAAGEPWTRDA